MGPKPIRIIQISDMHVLADDGTLLGVNTTQSLIAVLDLIKSQTDPDLLLLTGDLSQDESAASYVKIAQAVKKLGIPTYFVPGNHDNEQMIASVYPRETISEQKHVLLEHWQLILLNSKKGAAVEGYLAPSELAYLQHCLETYPEQHAIVVFHHHPVPVGSRWADEIGLQNAELFWRVVTQYPKVKAILFGHIHQEKSGEENGVLYFSAPSTCFQFTPNSEKFSLENLPQGFRWLNLHADGRLETGVTRLPEYVGCFQVGANTY